MKYNFNVGPAKLYPGVVKHLKKSLNSGQAIVTHRGPDFAWIYNKTQKYFKSFFEIPDDYHVFFTYSATNGMEVLWNSLGENIVHIVNGDFGDLWRQVSEKQGKNIESFESLREEKIDLWKIKTRRNTLCITANDTSTGVEYTPKELKKFREEQAAKTILIDATSSFGAINYDIRSADAWILSVQKNLGLPPGQWVLIISDALLQKIKKTEANYHSLATFEDFASRCHTPSTPNILLIEALGYISKKLKKDFGSAANLEKFTQEKADYFYKALKKHPRLHPLSPDSSSRTTFVLAGEATDGLRDRLESKGFVVSPWYGASKDQNIRIANFPSITYKEIRKLVNQLMKTY